MAAGSDVITGGGGADQILGILRGHFEPDGVDSVYGEVIRFSQVNRTDQTMVVSLAEFDALLRKAESEMQLSESASEAFTSVLRIKNAALSRPEESSVSAIAQGNPGCSAVATQMRRLLGPRGGADRQNVLVAADIGLPSEEKADLEARAAYRKARKEKWEKQEGRWRCGE